MKQTNNTNNKKIIKIKDKTIVRTIGETIVKTINETINMKVNKAMDRFLKLSLSVCFYVMLGFLLLPESAGAESHTIPVLGEENDYRFITGDTGQFESLTGTMYTDDYDDEYRITGMEFYTYSPEYVSIDTTGKFTVSGTGIADVRVTLLGQKKVEAVATGGAVATGDSIVPGSGTGEGSEGMYGDGTGAGSEGMYGDGAGAGSEGISGNGSDAGSEGSTGYEDGWSYPSTDLDSDNDGFADAVIHIDTIYFTFYICPDLADVKINKTSVHAYVEKESYYYSSMPVYEFKLKSVYELNDDDDLIEISVKSSNSKIGLAAGINENILTIVPDSPGKTKATITINNKAFKIEINTIQVNFPKKSMLLQIKSGNTLKLQGKIQNKIKWSSTNPKIVSVTKNGAIRGKKTGNAIIVAEIGGVKLGCAVSVVTPQRYKAIKRAIYIGRHCEYSQPKRMEENYYDCSSLVWKAYHNNGNNFGNYYYAPVAADLCKWCYDHGRLTKRGLTRKNVQEMNLNAGDLLFQRGGDNGRFMNIYHVEMIAGYYCDGFDKKGRPQLYVVWANRPVGYYGYTNEPVGRP